MFFSKHPRYGVENLKDILNDIVIYVLCRHIIPDLQETKYPVFMCNQCYKPI